MRIFDNDGITIKSFFSENFLMKGKFFMNPQWKEDMKDYKYDLKTIDGCLSYVVALNNFKNIPLLSDKLFYQNLLKNNKDKFMSRNEEKKRTKLKNEEKLNRRRRQPTAYNIFIGEKIQQLKLERPDIVDGKILMKMAISSWNNRKINEINS